MAIDRAGLANFLRRRRHSIQPEDVGLPRGKRRRTEGLRREEVAALCHMSADYYSRLERERGPSPSEQVVFSIAQGLRLSLEERDHLFRLAGHNPPPRGPGSNSISRGLLSVLDCLGDTPAEVINELGETLHQTPLSVALTGDLTRYTGPARSIGYRWFTDPATRARYAPEDHAMLSQTFTAALRRILTLRGPDSPAAHLAALLSDNEEFRKLWDSHSVGSRPDNLKRFIHPELGRIELHCQTLVDAHQSHSLLVYTAAPGSDSHKKLRLLSAAIDTDRGRETIDSPGRRAG